MDRTVLIPLGWVVVIGVGLAAGYAAGQLGDSIGKAFANGGYAWSSGDFQ